MDEVAISGIGRAVQVAKRARWEEHLHTGDFPSLGQLDLDLDVPRPVETQAYRQSVVRPMGLPVVRCKGRLHARAVRRLAGTILKLVEEQPPVIVLDVRDTGETLPALGQLQNLTRSQRLDHIVPLWIVGHEEFRGDDGMRFYRSLEDVFWALDSLQPRPRSGRGRGADGDEGLAEAGARNGHARD
jgi:hypothetical protein